jgi:aspartyl/glutamyl-tRNA(Asn/Gln) amidotransferase C subunit
MDISEIKHLAELAGINISDNELTSYSNIDSVIALISKIDNVDVSAVKPMSSPLDFINNKNNIITYE